MYDRRNAVVAVVLLSQLLDLDFVSMQKTPFLIILAYFMKIIFSLLVRIVVTLFFHWSRREHVMRLSVFDSTRQSHQGDNVCLRTAILLQSHWSRTAVVR